MNSRQFRTEIRKHTEYKSPDQLFSTVILMVGRPTMGYSLFRWEEKACRMLYTLTPDHLHTAAVGRFFAWLNKEVRNT